MAYPKIKVRSLRAFVAVYEEQSFSKAARRENTTQSGMSTQVKNLELILGTELLIRERRRFTLTPAGEIVYRGGQNVLKSLLETEKAVLEMKSTVSGLVRFGMIPSLTRSVLTPALHQYQSEFPDVELSLLEEYSHSLMRRVLDGEIDFAFVPSTELPSGLTGTFIGRDREMLVSGAHVDIGHKHLDAVSLSDLNNAHLIVPSTLNVRRKHLDTLLKTHGIHVAELLEMDGMLATLEMISASEWMAVLPYAICHPDKSGAVRRLNPIKDPPINLDYVMVEKSESALPRAARLLSECLIKHLDIILNDRTAAPAIENSDA